MRRILHLVAVAFGLCACTPAERSAWARWYEQDPVAAVEFANRPEVQADLHSFGSNETGPAEQNDSAIPASVWDELAECESGQTWDYNGGSGYDGGLQFLPATWRSYGGQEFAEFAWQASREAQIEVAERVLADVGWRAWPTCSRKLGLRGPP